MNINKERIMIGVLDFMLILGIVGIGFVFSRCDRSRWKL